MAVVLPTGVTATITQSGGSAVTLAQLTEIGGSALQMTMADVTSLTDTAVKMRPVKAKPGTAQFTLLLEDTATATNLYTVLRTYLTDKLSVSVAVGFPGTDIDTLVAFAGYVTEVGSPPLTVSDEPIKYTFTMQVTA